MSYNQHLYSKVVENRFMYLHKIQTMTDTEEDQEVSVKVDFQTVTESGVKSREYCAR